MKTNTVVGKKKKAFLDDVDTPNRSVTQVKISNPQAEAC